MKKIGKNVGILFLIITFISGLSLTQTVNAATPVQLVNKYNNALKTGDKLKILIVPGHDDEYWGTEFGDIKESDVNVAIGQYLYDNLKSDPRLDVQITRTQTGYTPTFKNYFANNREQIQQFITTSKTAHQAKLSSGEIKPTESVPHNNAQPEVALRLYGINKWANENDVDITLHLHINDAGGRVWGQAGPYTGIAVYIPENQFSNAGASAVVGEAIFKELILKNHVSTYPAESKGLIEDQDLIAIGASDTVKNAALLIEYGYIYEPQFQNLAIQEQVTKDLADQTYRGIKRFLGNPVTTPAATPSASNSQLPHIFKIELKKGMNTADVSALQAALTKAGVYSCGIVGTYGPCTEKGVKAFQKKYGISQTGIVGPLTRAKLNSLFGS